MTTRRSFFQRIAAVVAAVALAPEIAFNAALPLPVPEPFTCVMHGVTKKVTLYSTTWTRTVEMPEANLIIEQFSA